MEKQFEMLKTELSSSRMTGTQALVLVMSKPFSLKEKCCLNQKDCIANFIYLMLQSFSEVEKKLLDVFNGSHA